MFGLKKFAVMRSSNLCRIFFGVGVCIVSSFLYAADSKMEIPQMGVGFSDIEGSVYLGRCLERDPANFCELVSPVLSYCLFEVSCDKALYSRHQMYGEEIGNIVVTVSDMGDLDRVKSELKEAGFAVKHYSRRLGRMIDKVSLYEMDQYRIEVVYREGQDFNDAEKTEGLIIVKRK